MLTQQRSLVFIAAVLALGCGGSDSARGRATTPGGSRGGQAALASCESGDGRREVTLDVNGDRSPDVRQIYQGNVEVCREVDLNFDGRKDVFHYFDAQGREARLEDDLDFDSRIDQITFFTGGQVERREMDTNFDNRFDTWEYYSGGVIARTERDTNGDGRADFWERYSGGRIDRIQYDEDADGRPDRTDDNPDLGEESLPAAQPGRGAPEQTPPAPPAEQSAQSTEGQS